MQSPFHPTNYLEYRTVSGQAATCSLACEPLRAQSGCLAVQAFAVWANGELLPEFLLPKIGSDCHLIPNIPNRLADYWKLAPEAPQDRFGWNLSKAFLILANLGSMQKAHH